MSQLQSLGPLLPELALAIGSMLLLLYGVFRPETDADGRTVGWLAIVVLALAGALVVLQPAGVAVMFEGAFVVDSFARLMKLLVLAGSAVALLIAFDDLSDIRQMRFEYPVLILLSATGMLVMISAGDLIALYLGLEMQSLAAYVLASYRRDQLRSSEAGLKYFVLGALASGMLLYGASLVYGFTGSTSFQTIANVATGAAAGGNIGLIFGLVFVLVGIAFKISAVPFHMWTPDVYEGAPTPVVAFFASATKVAAMALLVRLMLTAFPGMTPQWQQIIVFLAIASMLLGSFAAIGQRNIKRLMAYSSIGHVGFALIGLAAASQEGTQGVILYMAIYLVMTLGAFACILSMRRSDGPTEDIGELAGLAQHNLPMAFVFGALMFSLAGIPPFAGFFAKFYVFLAAINSGLYTLAVIGVLASVVASYYYLYIVKVMFFDEPKDSFLPIRAKAGFVMALTTAIVLFVFIVPYLPTPLVNAAEAAARAFRY
ncbi:MAG: NADH-quinone oxidoreductase subunit NuoN [Hyphomicrobiaceae bacterium]|nr:NADH-quinone oxidoreductase subunit NuoN [Hyphomicrobiaceae bacterium]